MIQTFELSSRKEWPLETKDKPMIHDRTCDLCTHCRSQECPTVKNGGLILKLDSLLSLHIYYLSSWFAK